MIVDCDKGFRFIESITEEVNSLLCYFLRRSCGTRNDDSVIFDRASEPVATGIGCEFLALVRAHELKQ